MTGTPNFFFPTSPEADGHGEFNPQRIQTLRWTSPMTNRLLLEAGYGSTYYEWGGKALDGDPNADLVQVVNLTQAMYTDRDFVHAIPLAELVEQPDERHDVECVGGRT